MERDVQFEIQYLISLIIAVIGTITAGSVNDYIDSFVAYLFLILVFTHLVVFNISYSFASATTFEINIIDRLFSWLQWTLVAISLMFLFFILHMVGNIILGMYTSCIPGTNIAVTNIPDISSCNQSKIVMSYGVPVIIVAALGAGIGLSMASPLNIFKNMTFSVSPSTVRVFNAFEETEPILIKIENHTSETHSFEVQVDFPEEVVGRFRGVENIGTFTKSVEINADQQERLDIQLKYIGSDRRRDLMKVSLIHDKGRKEEELDVLLID